MKISTTLGLLRLRFGNNPLVTEQITYIEYVQENIRCVTDEVETHFGGGLRDDTYIQLDKFVQDTFGVRLDSLTDSVLEYRNRISIKYATLSSKRRTSTYHYQRLRR